MHGSTLRLLAFLFLAATAGCTVDDGPASPSRDPSPAPGANSSFPKGTIRGVVRWTGAIPEGQGPHLPRVNPATQGVGDAIVMLRDLDTNSTPRWPHGPVRVEVRDKQIRIVQDGHLSSVGLVRTGDEIEIVSVDSEFHSLRGRGAALFAIPLPEANRVAKRRLAQSGLVTLSSAANHPAMSACLLVVENGYVARTDARGNFSLPDVPAGLRTLACWMPNWTVKRRERDPASGLVARLHFEPPVERTLQIAVDAGSTREVTFTWSLADFERK